jgi:coproporphyrinogen III oxidase-like Fe-S oxidoreductase
VDLDLFDRRWGSTSRRWVHEELDEVFDAGLLDLEGTRLRLTPRGVLLANEVFGRLVGPSALAPSLPARG